MNPFPDNDPWAALGLSRGESDRATIRRAYAAALRANPPEEDAAAFRRVRDAYELLSRADADEIAWMAETLGALDTPGTEATEADETKTESVDETATRVEIVEPTAWEVGHEEPADAWRESTAAALDRVFEAPSEERVASARAFASEAWSQATASESRRGHFLGLLSSRPSFTEQGLLAAALPKRAFLESLSGPRWDLICWAATAFACTARERPLRTLATLALESVNEASAPGRAFDLLALAERVAITAPKLAGELADAAYAQATPAERRSLHTGGVDALQAVGREVAFWRPIGRARLALLVDRQGIPDDMRPRYFDPIAEGLIRTENAPRTYGLLEALAPKLLGRVRVLRIDRGRRMAETADRSLSGRAENVIQIIIILICLAGGVVYGISRVQRNTEHDQRMRQIREMERESREAWEEFRRRNADFDERMRRLQRDLRDR